MCGLFRKRLKITLDVPRHSPESSSTYPMGQTEGNHRMEEKYSQTENMQKNSHLADSHNAGHHAFKGCVAKRIDENFFASQQCRRLYFWKMNLMHTAKHGRKQSCILSQSQLPRVVVFNHLLNLLAKSTRMAVLAQALQNTRFFKYVTFKTCSVLETIQPHVLIVVPKIDSAAVTIHESSGKLENTITSR